MDLVRIEKSEGGKDVVDARHLHEVLEVSTRFNDWFSLMLSYGFKENIDYCRYSKVSNGVKQQVTNPNPKQDFYLTEDMCMHLAMIQRTDKGMEVRQWFIDRERSRNNQVLVPKNLKEALRLALQQQEELEQKDALLLEVKPKAEFYDAVTQSTSEISIAECAKVLNLPYGSITLFKKLREADVLMHTNVPYQNYISKGWFRVVESKYRKRDGTHGISLKTVVYQKGLEGILRLTKKI